MKTLPLIGLLLLAGCSRQLPRLHLEALDYVLVAHEPLYTRDVADKRYSIWTDNQETAKGLVESLGLKDAKSFTLSKGQVLVAFMNDRISEDLTQIVCNRSTRAIFADYADSGTVYKLRTLEPGRKYSALSVVVFSPPLPVGHFGLRSMVGGGLSEKR